MTPAATTENVPGGESPGNLGRNFFWMSWSGAVSIANSVLIWIFMARMRDVDEVGRFAIIMGLYALFFNIVSLGLLPYLINEISRRITSGTKRESPVLEFITSAHVFLLVSGLVSAGLMIACGFVMSESWQVRLSTLALSLAMIPTGLLVASEATAVSYGRARLVATISSVENLIRTVIPIGLIWAGYDLIVICLSFTVIRFIALTAYAAAAKANLKQFTFSGVEFKRILSVFPTFAGTILFASINWQAGLVMLGYLSTEAESAKYGTASRFLIPVSILMASYASVIQPAIASHLNQSNVDPGKYLSKVMRIPLFAATLAALCAPFLSEPVLGTFFGSTYKSAAPTLDILALSVIPFCLVMMIARGLVAINAQRVDLIANVLGVIVCLGGGVMLIPRYGAAGAAISQLLSFLAMAIAETVYISRKLAGFRIWRAATYSSASLLIIYMVLWKH
jgi:O-antigen/teichoic acid export membrane protein